MSDIEEEIFEIRCFIGDDRKMTHEMTQQEARIFSQTAKHLINYLTNEYDLEGDKIAID